MRRKILNVGALEGGGCVAMNVSDAVRSLLLKHQHKEGFSAASSVNLSAVYEPPVVPVRVRPEDAVPDYPQHRAVRKHLAQQPVPGSVALGEGVYTGKCRRCQLHGHPTGDRTCPYFSVGNLEAEAERELREDPLMAMAPGTGRAGSVKRESKLQQLNELLQAVKDEEATRKRDRKEKKLKKKLKKKLRKKPKLGSSDH